MADDLTPEDDLLIADSGEVPGDSEVRPDDRVDDERHDEENRLKPSFVSAVHDALEAGDWDRITKLAREAVEGAKQ